MNHTPKDIETILKKAYPEKTDTAIRVMLLGIEVFKKEIFPRLKLTAEQKQILEKI